MNTLSLLLLLFSTTSSVAQIKWERVRVPTSDPLHDIFFLNDSLGWSYSYGTGLILKTTDSGVNWDVVSRLDSVYFEQIQFVDASVGYLCGGNNHVLKTMDGGLSWVSIAIPHSSDALFHLTYAMHFHDRLIGWAAQSSFGLIARNNRTYVDWANGRHRILQTTDGGENWIALPPPPDQFLNFFFLSDSIAVATGSAGSVFRTTDYGRAWNGTFRDSAVGQIRGLWFVDQQNGFAVTWNGFVLKTIDGGRSWSASTLEGTLRSICFLDKKTGAIVGHANPYSLYITSDSGASWQPAVGVYPDLHRVRRSGHSLWICGKEGTILRGSTH